MSFAFGYYIIILIIQTLLVSTLCSVILIAVMLQYLKTAHALIALVPSVPLGVRSLPGVVVWGPPAHPNGDITRYDVRFCDSSQCLDIIAKKPSESYHIVSDDYIADLGSNIRVQV